MSRGRREALKRASARRSYVKSLRRRRRTSARSAVAAASAGAAVALSLAATQPADASDPLTLQLVEAGLTAEEFAAAGDTLYMVARDQDGARGLWRSDGTTAGTVKITGARVYVADLTATDDRVFFNGDGGTTGFELWTSDGTAAGTVLVKDIETGNKYRYGPKELTAVGDRLFFVQEHTVNTDHLKGLWISDGTEAGTTLVKDIGHGTDPLGTELVTLGDTVYFAGEDSTYGREVWSSDGTTAGTGPVKDINAGARGSYPKQFEPVGDEVYFTAEDPVAGEALWKTDGTDEGTVLVSDVARDGRGVWNFGDLTAVGDELYFTVDDGVHGHELWRSDGTAAGTVLVEDLNAGPGDSLLTQLTAAGDRLFFTRNHRQLWTSDGTAAGTLRLPPTTKDCGTTWCSSISTLTPVDDEVFFTAYDDRGRELWRSDGTSAGTSIVVDLNPGPAGSVEGNYELGVLDGDLFFSGDDGDHGPSLWKVTETASVPMCKGLPATISGTGRITGTSGADVIVGSSAADIIDGRGGDDVICARGGDDRVLQGVKADGADTVVGGTGTDAVSYASRTARLSVSLPDKDANDGAIGEHDKLVGVEDVRGGAGHDKIIGNFADNALLGGAGNDTLTGKNGDDKLRGEAGDDTLVLRDGIRGNDSGDGGTGTDSATSDPGDVVTGVP